MAKQHEISVFVTGGWDSTFMLCKMSRQKLIINPIYVLNKKRESRDYELAAIKRIIQALSKHPSTKAGIKPIKIINLEELDVDPTIVAARRRLMKRVGSLGYQYDYLATIAKNHGPIGVGIEYSPPEGDTGETAILTQLTKLVPGTYGLVIDKSTSDSDIKLVFGNMFFPIAEITELEMRDWAEKNGYRDIMKLTWFCHSPIDDKPCGLCRPCEEKMGSNMDFLLPKAAKERYYRAKKLSFLGERFSRPLKRRRLKQLRRGDIHA